MDINQEQFLKVLKEIKMLNSSYTLTGSQNFYLATNIDSRVTSLIDEVEKQSITIINPIKGGQNK
jgi:muramoyltetrapeptide carboxypeptidase LdcA involved in peptidoglycan recycling